MTRKKKSMPDPTVSYSTEELDLAELESLLEEHKSTHGKILSQNGEPESTTLSNHPKLVLQDVNIQADLFETLAKVSTTHRYINNGTANIETVYTFPLPHNAVLLEMILFIEDRKMTGQIIPKKQAEDRYEDAVVDGDLPVLLQNPSPGIYTLNIANIQPGERVIISFSYGLFLKRQGNDLRFTIPTTIAPRYGSSASAGLTEHQVPKTDFFTENRYQLAVTIHGQTARQKITSPSHHIDIIHHEDASSIRLNGATALMDRDFVLTITACDEDRSVLIWDRDGEKHLLWVGFHPSMKIESDTAPRGVVIVVDCSGSMQGDSINQARMATKGILSALRRQDYFNMMAFGSDHRTLFNQMKVADPKNIEIGDFFASRLQADMGGTELECALKNALKFTCGKAVSQDIILITDGEVWNVDEIIQLATRGNRRIFSIGVGSSPAESLLKTLSTNTGGACEFVFPGESMTDKIMRHVRRIYSPTIQCAETVWPVRPEEVYPEKHQGIFDGDTFHVFGWFADRPESGNVELSLTLSNGQTMQVSGGDVSKASTCSEPGTIARMGAALRLADMTDSETATALAVRYQLLCQYTHCLAVWVQLEAEKAQALPELHVIKQMLAAGWGGAGRVETIFSSAMDDFSLDVPTFFRRAAPIRCDKFDLSDIPAPAMGGVQSSISEDMDTHHPPCSLSGFIEYLNRYDVKSVTVRSSIIDRIPSDIRDEIMSFREELPETVSQIDNMITILLYLLLQLEVGKQLKRNITRIIKKRFKEARLSNDLVMRINKKIEPIIHRWQSRQ